jgi:hypothetical protein
MIHAMKLVTTILLALLIFSQALSKVWIVVSFKINQETIAKTLCIQKEVENNTCQGNCHLKEILEDSEQQEQDQNTTDIKNKIEIEYCVELSDFFLNPPFPQGIKEKINTPNNASFTFSFMDDIFHPPQPLS